MLLFPPTLPLPGRYPGFKLIFWAFWLKFFYFTSISNIIFCLLNSSITSNNSLTCFLSISNSTFIFSVTGNIVFCWYWVALKVLLLLCEVFGLVCAVGLLDVRAIIFWFSRFISYLSSLFSLFCSVYTFTFSGPVSLFLLNFDISFYSLCNFVFSFVYLSTYSL